MRLPKLLGLGALAIFSMIGVAAFVKKGRPASVAPAPVRSSPVHVLDDFPQIDRISQLFATQGKKLPIVETVTYSSRVPWLKGRPAWLADYATYYGTTKHFIARSLNGRPDYETQRVSELNKFNVFAKDRHFQFCLLVDLSLCKMGFYYVDQDTDERVLLKTYLVALGKREGDRFKTPEGVFQLGDKVAVYRPGTVDVYQGKQVEMIRVFGTRWIPLEGGMGLHGLPWEYDPKTKRYTERSDFLGKYATDGSIWLKREDMEELFAIVLSRPTAVYVTKHFKEAKLPGREVATPTR